MPMVEVWLGLLLAGFALEQRGEFYENNNIWVRGILLELEPIFMVVSRLSR